MTPPSQKQQLYCYVDETGQDTKGRLFVVAVVILGTERDELRDLLRRIEQASGKGKKKWSKATRRQRYAYLERVIPAKTFRGKLFYAHFEQTTDYLSCLLRTVANALTVAAAGQSYQATVLIDGLGKAERHRVGPGLRLFNVATRKVRGLRDESDEFIRLADTTAGLIREHLEAQDQVAERLYYEAVAGGVVQEV